MNAKEMQEEYVRNLLPKKVAKDRRSEALTDMYLSHVRNQAKELCRLIGHDNGIAYIKESLRDYPKELEEELMRFEKA